MEMIPDATALKIHSKTCKARLTVRLKSRRMHSLRVFLFLQRICLMSYRIEVAPEFARRLKNLSKRSLH